MAKRGPKPKKTEYYVEPDFFKQLLVDYYATDIIKDDLGICLNKIAEGLSYSSNFINYTYREEMVGDAVVKMFTAIRKKKFNIDSDNSPFSYFTTIAFNAFINRIKKEKKHHNTITEYRERMYEQELIECCEQDIYVKPTHSSDDDSSDGYE